MGRYDFRPIQVHQHASKLLSTKRLPSPPPWFEVMGNVPPAQTLIRTQPVQHHETPKRIKTKKPSKMFKPFPISYEEDRMREQFFTDHPWELARPRVILEGDGKDSQRFDWSQMKQSGRIVDGESVIQRHLWLLHNVPGTSSAKAYDQARHEFYDFRHQEDVERRVAREEAEATGAYFGKTPLETGMELEEQAYEDWKAWAIQETTLLRQQRDASSVGSPEDDVDVTNVDDPEVQAGVEESPDSVPAQGQEVEGDTPAHP